jgi:hypothetical protein
MAVYEVDELSFDVPDGFEDKSLNVFVPANAGTGAFSITVSRMARSQDPLATQVQTLLDEMEEKLPRTRVVGQRERLVGTTPGREARIHTVHDRIAMYQRLVFVSYYGTLLMFAVSGVRAQSVKCDAIAERLVGNLKFKKAA